MEVGTEAPTNGTGSPGILTSRNLTEPNGAVVTDSKIIYTKTDEAPMLATYSFLPIIQAYAG